MKATAISSEAGVTDNDNNNEISSLNSPGEKRLSKRRQINKKERKSLKKKRKNNVIDGVKNLIDNTKSKKSTHLTKEVTTRDDREEKEKEILYLKSYSPILIPSTPSAEVISNNNNSICNSDSIPDDAEGGSVGKWFPKALLIKCSISYTNTGVLINNKQKSNKNHVHHNPHDKNNNPRSSLVLFYQYTSPKWDKMKLQLLMTYLSKIVRIRNIGGRIRVASEGLNVTISAVDIFHSVNSFTKKNTTYNNKEKEEWIKVSAAETLRHFAEDLRKFDPQMFSSTDFKYIDNLPPDRHFKECKLIPVKEIVYYGIKSEDAPLEEVGVHLDAKEYHEMLKKDNTVVIDVRNHYETILGRFNGQMVTKKADEGKGNQEVLNDEKKISVTKKNGAEYIDPLMRKSTDFPEWLSKPETKEKLQGKNVLMYCTGGVRCERASAYLRKQMASQVNGVYQLQGGIERYLKAFPDGGFWRGKNFVFDKREAISVDNVEGDGGVIRRCKRPNKKIGKNNDKGNFYESDLENDLPSKCCVCDKKWDRYVGKKKCYTCGVPVLMCDKCMSKKSDKVPGMKLDVRCSLCVAEGVTVPADEVEFTDNGIKGVFDSSLNKKNFCESKHKKRSKQNERKNHGACNEGDKNPIKAANSVLKWGGGYATKKRDLRKMKRTVCQFGAECIRKDCYFLHPERKVTKTN